MEKKQVFFGYTKEQVLENFRQNNNQVDSNGKISTESTLSQLAEASNRLVEENADFLYEIYNNLDE